MDWWLKIELSIESFQKQITKIAVAKTPIHFETHETKAWMILRRSKSWQNLPIFEDINYLLLSKILNLLGEIIKNLRPLENVHIP